MNNEPVAWMDKESGVVCKEVYATEMPNNLIPLYTHPVKEVAGFFNASEPVYPTVKELTDEEIMNIFNNWTNSKQEHNLPVGNINYFYQEMLDFARAILRKAQEK